MQQLSLCTRTTEAHTLEPMIHKKSHRNEKPVHRNEESPLLAATRESQSNEDSAQAKKKKKRPIQWDRWLN